MLQASPLTLSALGEISFFKEFHSVIHSDASQRSPPGARHGKGEKEILSFFEGLVPR